VDTKWPLVGQPPEGRGPHDLLNSGRLHSLYQWFVPPLLLQNPR